METYCKAVDCLAADSVAVVGIVAGGVRNTVYRGGAVGVIAAAYKYSNPDQIVDDNVDQRTQSLSS